MISLKLPVSEEEVRKLKVGDEISLNGIMVLGRDNAHVWMHEEKPDEIRDLLKGTVIYHCGPVVKKVDDEWIFVAAGPTTSIRKNRIRGVYLRNIIFEL